MTKDEYAAYLKSDHWQEFRKGALERAGNKCKEMNLMDNAEEAAKRRARITQAHHRSEAPNDGTIEVDVGLFEMLLNSIANLKHISEVGPETQKSWLETIDNKWDEGMKVLSKHRSMRGGE